MVTKRQNKNKPAKRAIRHNRIRSRIIGTAERPRLAVFRSNRFLYAQLINDKTQTTLLSGDTRSYDQSIKPIERAKKMGVELAKKAIKEKVKKVVFDRGGFSYRGSIVAFADSARSGGLEF